MSNNHNTTLEIHNHAPTLNVIENSRVEPRSQIIDQDLENKQEGYGDMANSRIKLRQRSLGGGTLPNGSRVFLHQNSINLEEERKAQEVEVAVPNRGLIAFIEKKLGIQKESHIDSSGIPFSKKKVACASVLLIVGIILIIAASITMVKSKEISPRIDVLIVGILCVVPGGYFLLRVFCLGRM